MTGEKESPEVEMVNKALTTLSEHWETVHVFACRECDDGENIEVISRGNGNYLTRFGQIVQWVEKEKHDARREKED